MWRKAYEEVLRHDPQIFIDLASKYVPAALPTVQRLQDTIGKETGALAISVSGAGDNDARSPAVSPASGSTYHSPQEAAADRELTPHGSDGDDDDTDRFQESLSGLPGNGNLRDMDDDEDYD